MDLRYLKKPLARVGVDRASQCRGDICSFLEYVYDGIAETLPDFRDELGGCHGVEINVDDPYQVEMHNALQSKEKLMEDCDLQPKKKKPRKTKRQVALNLERTSKEEKWLQPGSMKEYWEQYRAQSSLEKPASFASFWRATWRNHGFCPTFYF